MAFITRAGPPLEYLICYTGPSDGLLVGDEVVISRDVPGHGRSYEVWIADEKSFITSRGMEHVGFTRLTNEEFFNLPGLKSEGIVVAVYEDRRRKKVLQSIKVRNAR